MQQIAAGLEKTAMKSAYCGLQSLTVMATPHDSGQVDCIQQTSISPNQASFRLGWLQQMPVPERIKPVYCAVISCLQRIFMRRTSHSSSNFIKRFWLQG